MEKEEILAELAKYIDVKGIAVDLLFEKVIYDIVIAKVAEKIPGDLDDSLFAGARPMARKAVEDYMDGLVGKLKGEEASA